MDAAAEKMYLVGLIFQYDFDHSKQRERTILEWHKTEERDFRSKMGVICQELQMSLGILQNALLYLPEKPPDRTKGFMLLGNCWLYASSRSKGTHQPTQKIVLACPSAVTNVADHFHFLHISSFSCQPTNVLRSNISSNMIEERDPSWYRVRKRHIDLVV